MRNECYWAIWTHSSFTCALNLFTATNSFPQAHAGALAPSQQYAATSVHPCTVNKWVCTPGAASAIGWEQQGQATAMPARTGTQLVAPPLPSDTVMPPVTAEQEDPVANERSCGCVEVLCLKYDDRDGNGARSVHNTQRKPSTTCTVAA